jgi:predicted glycosyltransferase
MDAADLVISMGGYNTICEILSLGKRAIVVPRVHPVQEQWIRAERMAKLGCFQTIHPHCLTPNTLIQQLQTQLQASVTEPVLSPAIDLNALPRITQMLAPALYYKFRTLQHNTPQLQCVAPIA